MNRLSDRLQIIAKMVSPGRRVADVGTDHAYVPIELVGSGKCPYALAMDIKKGPLEAAAGHISEEGLGSRIECRLSDGLEQYTCGEADSFIIAGMGGELIVRILADGIGKLADGNELVLCPHTHVREVREFLCGNGFEITDEEMVCEDGKFYSVIQCVFHSDRRQYILNDTELDFGRILIQKKHPVLIKYLDKEEKKFEDIGRYLERISETKKLITE